MINRPTIPSLTHSRKCISKAQVVESAQTMPRSTFDSLSSEGNTAVESCSRDVSVSAVEARLYQVSRS